MRKITRIAAFALALSLCAVSMTGCGDKKTEEQDIEQAIGSMDDKELESKLEEAAEQIEKEEADAKKSPDSYAPSDEIKNAGFESGLIQIGSDVFRRGGYYTVEQFADEFSDRYDFYADYSPWESTEFNLDGLYDSSENSSFVIIPKNDDSFRIRVNFRPADPEETGPVAEKDCVVTDFDPYNGTQEPVTCIWYPQNNDDLKYTEVEAFLDSYGLMKKENANDYDPMKYDGSDHVLYRDYDQSKEYDYYFYCGKAGDEPEGYYFYVRSDEKNLFGAYPVYKYSYHPDYDTGKVDTWGSIAGMLNTDDWKSAKDSQ